MGWADFQVRADRAIRRHWQLVCCAFSFCWWASLRRAGTAREEERRDEVLAVGPSASFPPLDPAGVAPEEPARPLLSWPLALRQVQGWLDPWTMLWR